MIVLDANILVRAVLGRRVRQILESYSAKGIAFYAPEAAFIEVQTHLPKLLEKRGKSAEGVMTAVEYLRFLITPIEAEFYEIFEEEARERLRGRDEEDWPILASALGLGMPIWTEDADFFGTGVAVWTTSRVEIFLERQAKRRGLGESGG